MVARNMTKPATKAKIKAKNRLFRSGWRLLPWPRAYRVA